MPEIIVIAHNIRSVHNVGSIFRTCEGFGASQLILFGYTPYPICKNDTRLPHVARKLTDQIHKTALGAELIMPFAHTDLIDLNIYKNRGYRIAGLEQSDHSVLLSQYHRPDKLVLLIGEEVRGIPATLLEQCDDILEIPMKGKKESFNVSVATGIALYQLSQ